MNNSNIRLTKFYHGCNPRQQAGMFFEHLASDNSLELARIEASVTLETVLISNFKFRDWLHKLQSFKSIWSMHHLQLFAKHMRAMAVYFSGEYQSRDVNDESPDYLAESRRLLASLAASNNALIAICGKHGVNPDVIRQGLGIEPIDTTSVEPDLDYQRELTSALEQIFTPTTNPQ